jgi:putative endonuclease
MSSRKRTGVSDNRRPGNLWRGNHAENIALRYLRRSGLTLLARNYRCRRGEIDLVMQHAGQLVFVEVRYRNRAGYGTPAETICAAKIRRLRLAAETFLQNHDQHSEQPARFDVVALSGPLKHPSIDWIRDAF